MSRKETDVSSSCSEREGITGRSDRLHVEAKNMSHFWVGRSSPPPNHDHGKGQAVGSQKVQNGGTSQSKSIETGTRPGPQVFVSSPIAYAGQHRVSDGRARNNWRPTWGPISLVRRGGDAQ